MTSATILPTNLNKALAILLHFCFSKHMIRIHYLYR